MVLEVCNRQTFHLTAAVVSSNVSFVNKVLGSTVNGITSAGIRASTTSIPFTISSSMESALGLDASAFHQFGPGGDPRAASIATPEGIRLVWSCNREIVRDEGEISPM